MTKQQKIEMYTVFRQGLVRDFPNLIADLTEAGLSETEVDAKIAAAISALKGGADADHDTLKELADAIVANALDTTIPTQADIETEIGVCPDITLLTEG